MAIIYSYPIVTPTSDDLILGTDVNGEGKPTKNFTVQSIVDIVSGGAAGLGAVIKINSSAKDPATNTNQSAIDFLNVQGTGTSTFNVFTDGSMTITGGVGTGFSSITSTDFDGDLTGVVKAGSSIQSTVTGVTQNQGDNSTKLATTAYVDNKVDPSVLQYLGDSTGPFDLSLVNDDFKIAGTANQIETTATNVAGNVGTVTLKFPTAGVTLPDGSVATTQATSDDSTKVATTAFVRDYDDLQDLDFTTGSGSGSVLLNSQTLTLSGTTNQITTSGSGQTATFALASSITISGTYTGTTFSGDLNGTINTATTGVTQNAGDDSTKIATTAYVDAAAGAKTLDYAGDATGPFTLNLSTDDLEFNGDSNISVSAAAVAANKGIVTIDLNNDVTISGTMQAGTLSDGTFSGTAGTYTGGVSITSTDFVGALTGNASTATALAAAGTMSVAGDVTTVPNAPTYTSGGNKIINTTIADTVVTAKVLTNLPTPTSAAIAASDTILAAMAKLQGQITGIPQGLVYKGTWNANTNTPTLASGTGITGEFYIVSVAGNTNLDGITDWQVGDWAIFVEVGATDTWQKIDNTSAILGSGTANKIAKWTGSNTLATGLIADDGTTVTVGNSGNLVVEGNTTLGDAVTDTTTVKGPGVFEEALRINKGISLGANTYGSAGQVLTSGGGAAAVNTWTTPTTGTVTSVGLTETGDALTITGSPITTSGTINIAGAGASTQYINGELNLVTFPTVDNYVSWTLAGDTGTSQTIGSTNTATFAGGFGISTAASATDTLTTSIDITGADNAIAGLTAATPVATDTLWFNDISDSNTIRKATIADIVDLGNETLAEVLTNGNTTGGTDIAVGANDDITFTDSSRAKFGAAPDLQIYHDGSNSYIKDSGTGDLRIWGDNVNIGTASGNKVFFSNSGVAELYYTGGAKKLETTSTGIEVTGGGTFNGSIMAFSTVAAPAVPPAAEFILRRDNAPAINNEIGKIQFQAENPVSANNWVAGAQIIATASAAWSQTVKDTKLDFYTFQGNASASRLTIKASGDARFYQNVEIDGNLTVDGHIIHGGGGGGTGKGGTFTKLYTTGNAGVAGVAFTISRATTGSMIFDVMLTSDTSTACAVAKKYTVVKSYGASPLYNKILDTGPDFDTSDFNVVFAQDTTDLSIKCTITPVYTNTQKIGITLDLGFGQNDATVVMN